ncbi:MAG: ATP-binding protein, partial [Synergistaceae bacterium]
KENQRQLLEYRARLRELATQLTISEENTRREIATDLHDSIGHSLLTLLLDLRKMGEDHELSSGAAEALGKSIKVAEQMIAESRQLIFELSPPILLEVGITPAVEALADHLLTPRGIGWTVTERGRLEDFSADDAVCVILYRMSRELLVNVIKHSYASKVSIGVNRGPKKIQIVIEDNGIGFSVKKGMHRTAGCGLGLFSIRERLIHIGGDMQIISNSGGTTISLLAPLHLAGADTEQEKNDD